MELKLKQDIIRTIRVLQYDAESIKKDEIDKVLLAVQKSINYVEITSLHLDDLMNLGFLPNEATDIERIASKMSDDYCDQLFNESLYTIAKANNVYHSDRALQTLCSLCEDLHANFDAEQDRKTLKKAKDVLFFTYTDKEFGEWQKSEVQEALDIISHYLPVLGDDKAQEPYIDLINRVKKLIQWSNNSSTN